MPCLALLPYRTLPWPFCSMSAVCCSSIGDTLNHMPAASTSAPDACSCDCSNTWYPPYSMDVMTDSVQKARARPPQRCLACTHSSPACFSRQVPSSKAFRNATASVRLLMLSGALRSTFGAQHGHRAQCSSSARLRQRPKTQQLLQGVGARWHGRLGERSRSHTVSKQPLYCTWLLLCLLLLWCLWCCGKLGPAVNGSRAQLLALCCNSHM